MKKLAQKETSTLWNSFGVTEEKGLSWCSVSEGSAGLQGLQGLQGVLRGMLQYRRVLVEIL